MAIFNLFLHMYYTTTKVRIKRNEHKKLKSHINGFFYLYMAFQEGFEPPTDSLEGILLIFNTIGFKDLNHVFTKILIFLFSKPFHF